MFIALLNDFYQKILCGTPYQPLPTRKGYDKLPHRRLSSINKISPTRDVSTEGRCQLTTDASGRKHHPHASYHVRMQANLSAKL